MREHPYRDINIPDYLLSDEKIKIEFKNVINNQKITSGNTLYNDNDKIVKNTLKKLYHTKCAYCESSLRNAYGHIEHYRPKSIYYWLVFAWDNLLPCCEICNITKGTIFKVTKEQKTYNKETLKELHNSLTSYNKDEEPMLLHPEINKFEKDLQINRKGVLCSKKSKLRHTIRVYNLNREGIQENREAIITNYCNDIKKYSLLLKDKDTDESVFILFDSIIEKSDIKKEYSFVSLCIKNNFYSFIDECLSLNDTMKKQLKELWDKYNKQKANLK